MNSLAVLLAVQTIVSILLIVWVRLKVMRSLDDGDSIARVRREIGALIIELDGSADRNITVIEDRLRELKDCIAEADKRIVMLSNERAGSWAAPPIPLLHKSQDRRQAPLDQQQATQPLFQPPLQPAPETRLPEQNAPQTFQPPPEQTSVQAPATLPVDRKEKARPQDSSPTGSVRTTSVPFIRFSDKPLVFEEPFAERVARLHKRGFSSDIIAAKLKATIAEVDLAIAAGWNPPEGRGEG